MILILMSSIFVLCVVVLVESSVVVNEDGKVKKTQFRIVYLINL